MMNKLLKVKLLIFSYPSVRTFVLGAQKNSLIMMVLLSTHNIYFSSGPEVIKLFSCSTQLSTKFQLLIKTKILTNEEVSCFKSLRCCIYHANKC